MVRSKFVGLIAACLCLATTTGAVAATTAGGKNSAADWYKAHVAAVYGSSLMAAGPYAAKSPYVQDWLKKANQASAGTAKNPYSRTLSLLPHGAALPAASTSYGAPVRSEQQAIGGDYLAEMVRNGVQRWAPSAMPLRLCIGGGDSRYANIAAQAMSDWCTASGGKISWQPTNDPYAASIDLNFLPNGTSRESGETRKSFGPGGYIAHANVDVDTTENGRTYSDAEIKKICLHELGHALGLDHSTTACDIMYWQSNGQQMCALGPRDSATIRRLYSTN